MWGGGFRGKSSKNTLFGTPKIVDFGRRGANKSVRQGHGTMKPRDTFIATVKAKQSGERAHGPTHCISQRAFLLLFSPVERCRVQHIHSHGLRAVFLGCRLHRLSEHLACVSAQVEDYLTCLRFLLFCLHKWETAVYKGLRIVPWSPKTLFYWSKGFARKTCHTAKYVSLPCCCNIFSTARYGQLRQIAEKTTLLVETGQI